MKDNVYERSTKEIVAEFEKGERPGAVAVAPGEESEFERRSSGGNDAAS